MEIKGKFALDISPSSTSCEQETKSENNLSKCNDAKNVKIFRNLEESKSTSGATVKQYIKTVNLCQKHLDEHLESLS